MSIQALYKYGSIGEYSESLFATPTIWFSSPAALNDPFECRPWFTFDGSEQEFLEVFERIARKHFPKYGPQEVKAEAGRMYAQGRHKDRKFLEPFRDSVVKMLSERIGLYCLSKTNTNILMWSHYAHDHAGFCLEFSASDHTPFFGEAQEVKYATEFPVVDFFKTPNDVQVDLIFLTKFIGWQYEEECRIIDHQSGPGLHSYPVELLKSVTFGLRMPEDEKQKIRGWLAKRGTRVKLFQAAIDQREFKIVTAEVQ